MQTYSHLIVTAALKRPVEKIMDKNPDAMPEMRTGWLLFGSVVPDLLLTIIAIVCIARDLILGVFRDVDFDPNGGGGPSPELLEVSWTVRLFDVWFFENPWVIAAQNVLHGPIVVAFLMLFGYLMWRRGKKWGGALFWFSTAAMLHTLVDIPLHVDDGPLVFFPFNWSYRYEAPISYWDPDHFGREWSIFEHTLDLLLLIYLFWINRFGIRDRFGRRFGRKAKTAGA